MASAGKWQGTLEQRCPSWPYSKRYLWTSRSRSLQRRFRSPWSPAMLASQSWPAL